MRLGPMILALAALTVSGCATATAGDDDASAPRSSSSRDVLEGDQIRAAGGQIRTALDAVEQLRPHFLRNRANPTVGVAARRVDPVVVYVNGIRRGGVRELAQIRVEQVLRIVYIRPSNAQTRYGLDHSSGAIEVTMHGGG